MALFRVSDLERRARITRSESRRTFKTADSILREDARGTRDATSFDNFLSHSYLNADSVLALKAEIESIGFGVYVDWVVDSHTDREDVTKETADLIRKRMGQCKSLFYVTSSAATDSKWMPWKLGYFDGKKQKVAITLACACSVPRRDSGHPHSRENGAGVDRIDLRQTGSDWASCAWPLHSAQ